MTKTNFTLVRELDEKYHPQTRGIISPQEVELIKETLELKDATELELRNMRDFVVIYLGNKSEKEDGTTDREAWDKMSAITHVIDCTLFEKGCTV